MEGGEGKADADRSDGGEEEVGRGGEWAAAEGKACGVEETRLVGKRNPLRELATRENWEREIEGGGVYKGGRASQDPEGTYQDAG